MAVPLSEPAGGLRSGVNGPRQVPGPRIGLAGNPGGWLGADAAACCLHILQA